ncbi:hypothetical protein ACS0TY_022770 [Phlomoides rotata]
MLMNGVAKQYEGKGNFGWAFRAAVGRSGGIITVWDSDVSSCSSWWHMEGAVVVNGFWGEERTECSLVNIYAPCPLSERVELWDRICYVVNQNESACICICGDFNSIRRMEERVGTRAESGRRDVAVLDNFIREAGPIDLPIHGRSYT